MININISNHAIMRFAQRVHGELIVNDRTFQLWMKNNEELVEQYKTDIECLFLDSESICKNTFDNKKGIFHLHKESMLVFVKSEKDDTVITVYDVDYDLDEIGNKSMLSILLEQRQRVESSIFEYDASLEKENAIVSEKIYELNNKINLLELQLRQLNSEKSKVNDEINISKLEKDKMSLNLDAINQRIVRPKYSK